MAKLLFNGVFIVAGIHYVDMPSNFQVLQEYGQKSSFSLNTANRGRVTTLKSKKVDEDDYTNERKAKKLAYRLEFENASLELKNHLYTLFSTSAKIFVQLDDVMSREYAELLRSEDDPSTFFTPEYPIVPFGGTPPEPETFEDDVYLTDGTTIVTLSDGFEVDQDNGIITFGFPLDEGIRAFMRYTWKCPVRVAECQFHSETIAQMNYNGYVVLEQVDDSGIVDSWEGPDTPPDPPEPPVPPITPTVPTIPSNDIVSTIPEIITRFPDLGF